MEKTFLIITFNRFPTGDAGAVRLQAFAAILKSLGYSPYVIGMGDTTGFKNDTFDGITYCSLRYSKASLVYRALGRLLYAKHLKEAVKALSHANLQGILIDSGNASSFRFIRQYAKKKGIPLYYDSVEWYSPSEFKRGEKDAAYLHNNSLNTKIINADYKVIAISTYLENNFKNRGVSVIRIPVIMDVRNISVDKKPGEGLLKIVYAGSIGNKDHITELVDAICLLNEQERRRIVFCVMGITREQYEAVYGEVDENIVGQSIIFMGRVDRSTVLEQLNSADFAFLLRPSHERYAMAGFPTKVVEGLATGTPIMCNYSSDLAIYLKDGINSAIIDDCSAEACVKALRKILTYSQDELSNMKFEARKTAEDNFDWRLYVNLFDRFIYETSEGVIK